MTRFEYVSIFNGIVIALAMENVASSLHKLFEAGGRVRWHWMAPTNAVAAVVATLGQFWVFWVQRANPALNTTFLTFLPGAVSLFLQYLVTAAALPDTVPEAGIDLKEFYFSSRRQYWSLLVANTLLIASIGIWQSARHGFDAQFVRFVTPLVLGALLVSSLAASMIVVRASWWHTFGIALITSCVFFLFLPMTL